MVVADCWKTVTLVAPVTVVKAQSDGRAREKVAVAPLATAVATVPVSPWGMRTSLDAIIVPAIELPPIMPLELIGITFCPA